VRERMEAQHAEMVRALKGGELDAEVGLVAAAPGAAAGAASGGATADRPAAPVASARKIREFGEGVIGDTRLDELILSRFSPK